MHRRKIKLNTERKLWHLDKNNQFDEEFRWERDPLFSVPRNLSKARIDNRFPAHSWDEHLTDSLC
jgi:hypothetical protein